MGQEIPGRKLWAVCVARHSDIQTHLGTCSHLRTQDEPHLASRQRSRVRPESQHQVLAGRSDLDVRARDGLVVVREQDTIYGNAVPLEVYDPNSLFLSTTRTRNGRSPLVP